MKKLFLLLAAAATCLAGFAQNFAYPSGQSVNVRATPSSSGKKLGTLYKSEGAIPVVGELDSSSKWTKVQYNGQTGYISTDYSIAIMQEPVPENIYGKTLESMEALDEVRHTGDITITKKDASNVVISMGWMRNDPKTGQVLPYEGQLFLGKITDGKVMATHRLDYAADPELPLNELQKMAETLDNPVPVLINEFDSTLIFYGGVFSML